MGLYLLCVLSVGCLCVYCILICCVRYPLYDVCVIYVCVALCVCISFLHVVCVCVSAVCVMVGMYRLFSVVGDVVYRVD